MKSMRMINGIYLFYLQTKKNMQKQSMLLKLKPKNFKKYEKLELNFDLFKETLNKYYEIMEDLEKVSYYAMLQLETDVTNKDSNKIYSICVNIATKVSNATSFFMPKILKTDEKKIQAWINKPELKEKKIAIEKY